MASGPCRAEWSRLLHQSVRRSEDGGAQIPHVPIPLIIGRDIAGVWRLGSTRQLRNFTHITNC